MSLIKTHLDRSKYLLFHSNQAVGIAPADTLVEVDFRDEDRTVVSLAARPHEVVFEEVHLVAECAFVGELGLDRRQGVEKGQKGEGQGEDGSLDQGDGHDGF